MQRILGQYIFADEHSCDRVIGLDAGLQKLWRTWYSIQPDKMHPGAGANSKLIFKLDKISKKDTFDGKRGVTVPDRCRSTASPSGMWDE